MLLHLWRGGLSQSGLKGTLNGLSTAPGQQEGPPTALDCCETKAVAGSVYKAYLPPPHLQNISLISIKSFSRVYDVSHLPSPPPPTREPDPYLFLCC